LATATPAGKFRVKITIEGKTLIRVKVVGLSPVGNERIKNNLYNITKAD
jgi:hypothetical protein